VTQQHPPKEVAIPTPTQVVAERVKQLRNDQGLSAQRLADRCAEAGAVWLDRSVIANLESGRRQSVSIDEVLVLALVLNVAPVHLFVPVTPQAMHVSPKWAVGAPVVRQWVRGLYPLPSQDARVYRSNVPDEEWTDFESKGRPASPEELKAIFGEENIIYAPGTDEEG
jgi:transcriptional regulator with XRE-family HTH domain